MADTYDAVVVGAGIIGASVSMQLAAGGLRVLTLERRNGGGQGSTSKSSAQVSCTYAYDETSRLSWETLGLLRHWSDFTGLAETRADFRRSGCLQLTRADNPAVPRIEALHQRLGIPSQTLDAEALRKEFPAIDFASNRPDLAAADYTPEYNSLGVYELEAGYADAVGTTQDYLAAARQWGAELRCNADVVAVTQAGGRVTGVEVLQDGVRGTVHAPVVVNCAGPWAAPLNTLAGVPLPYPFVNIRAQMVNKTYGEVLPGHIPLVRDRVNNLYFRLEANGVQFHVGPNDPADLMEAVDPDDYKDTADPPLRERQLAMLQHRVPGLVSRGTVTTYAGLYCNYQLDNYPVIDRSPLEGFVYAIGLGGEGFKMSPVVGMMVSHLVTGQIGRGSTEVPLTLFRQDRDAMLNVLWETQALGTAFISAGPLAGRDSR